MKRLLVLKPYLVAKTNGGEISLIERLQRFQSWGCPVEVHVAVPESSKNFSAKFLNDEMKTPLSMEGSNGTYEIDGLQIRVHFSPHFHPTDLAAAPAMEFFFQEKISQFHPDIVLAHSTDFFAVTSAMKWDPARSWILFTDDEYPRMPALHPFPTIAEAYRKMRTVVVASHFMEKSLKESFPWTEPLWIPNPISVEELGDPVSGPHDCLLFVNPTKVKGLEFMMDLVKEMPHEKFLFVGNWTNEIPDLQFPKNVEWLPRQNGLAHVFGRSKILLMPSVWNEAFGRLVLEAMSAQVAVIASNRGALSETVGSGGLSLPLDISTWKTAIEKMNQPNDWKSKGQLRLKRYHEEVERGFNALRENLA